MDKTQPCRKVLTRTYEYNIKKPLEFVDNIPENFTWGNVNGVNYLTNIRN